MAPHFARSAGGPLEQLDDVPLAGDDVLQEVFRRLPLGVVGIGGDGGDHRVVGFPLEPG